MNAMIRLDAGHDRNGNPRRCYVLLATDGLSTDIVGAWDEGYEGHAAVPEKYRGLAKLAPTFKTTPGEVRDTLRHGADLEPESEVS